MRHFLAFVVAIAMVIAAAGLKAQSRTGSAPPPGPDMSGLWLVQDPGSGSWSAWFNNVPKPALRPAIIKDNGEIEAREAAGNVVNTMPWRPDCPVGNLPMMMASSPPLNIVAARDEVLIAAESGRGRFIYTDGRPHPDTKASSYVASGFGHSTGRWEGDTLAVDTIGFPARVCDSRRPVMLVPGGWPREGQHASGRTVPTGRSRHDSGWRISDADVASGRALPAPRRRDAAAPQARLWAAPVRHAENRVLRPRADASPSPRVAATVSTATAKRVKRRGSGRIGGGGDSPLTHGAARYRTDSSRAPAEPQPPPWA